jgi:flagellar hook-associated protein 2
MGTISFPGLQTGIDTSTIIQMLMEVEKRTLNTYQTRKNTLSDKDQALSDLKSKLSNLRSSVSALSSADSLRAYKVSSSDSDKITAEASKNAFEGNHTVVVNQLANAERWVHTAGKEYVEDTVGVGTFTYSYNNKETSVTTTSTTTLQDLVGLINNDANNPGVTAGLLYYNKAYHLVLNGNEAGSDYSIRVNSSSTKVWKAHSELTCDGDNATLATKIVDLDQFIGTLGAGDKIIMTGTNRNGVTLGTVELAVNGNTKVGHLISEINNAFDGIAKATFENGKIILTDNVCGTSELFIDLDYSRAATFNIPAMEISTAGGTSTGLDEFAGSDFTVTQFAKDSKIKVDGYPTTTDVPEVQTLTPTVLPTGGTFTLTYRGQTTAAINHDATIIEIQNALGLLSNVNDGDIEVGGTRLSEAGATTFIFSSALGDVDMISIDSSGLTHTPPLPRSNYVMAEQTKGDDGYIRRSSNTIDDVISGVTLHLHDVTGDNGEEVTLTRDIQSVKDKINTMVTAYNSAMQLVKDKTGYNSTTKVAGVLMGDSIVTAMQNQFRGPLVEQTSGFTEDIDTFLSPASIGLELDKDGVLSFDEGTFDEAVSKHYLDVLAIIGADKNGSSTSDTIKFYGASSNYTKGGEYDVMVTVDGGAITVAQIKLSSEPESAYRSMTVNNNVITGNSTFNSSGYAVYPENGLQLSVNLVNGDYAATVRVKQGFSGNMEDSINNMLKTTSGSLVIDQKYIEDQINGLSDKVDKENDRLTKYEGRLKARYARLEKTLALLQSQMSAVTAMNG